MKKTLFILSIILMPALIQGCGKVSPAGLQPLEFDKLKTKAGLSSIHSDFEVWASSQDAEGSADIMSGYRVNHTVEGWSYTLGEGTEGQELQFWSESAGSYRFHAGAPLSRVAAMNASSLTLQMEATTDILQTSLFSEPYLVKRGDPAFGSTVNLAFVYANSKVNLAFRCASSADVSITDIKLTPPSAYATSGQLELYYDWDRPAVSVKALSVKAESTDELAFHDLLVPAGSTQALQTSSPWYLIPQVSAKGQWKMSATLDGIPQEVYFTLSKGWEPGRSYLYRFEYTDEANLVFLGTDETLFIGKNPEDGGNHNFS